MPDYGGGWSTNPPKDYGGGWSSKPPSSDVRGQGSGSWGEVGDPLDETTTTPKRKLSKVEQIKAWASQKMEDERTRSQRPFGVQAQEMLTKIGNTRMLPLGQAAQALGGNLGPLPDPTLAGMVRGVSDLPTGAGRLIANVAGAFGADELAQDVNRGHESMNRYFDENFDKDEMGRMAGGALPFLMTGGASAGQQALSVGQKVAQAARAAAEGAGFGLASQKSNVPEGEYWDRAGQDALFGGVVGAGLKAATPYLARGGSWLMDKAAQAKDKLMGIPRNVPTELRPDFRGAPELGAKLEREGIKSYTPGDITGDLHQRKIEDSLVRNTEEGLNYRQQGNREVQAMSERKLAEARKAMKDSGWGDLAEIEKAAADPKNKRHVQALEIKKAIEGAGGDTLETAQVSGNIKLLKGKMQADKDFDAFTRRSERLGAGDTSGIYSQIQAILKRIKGNSAAEKSIGGIMNDMEAGFRPGKPGVKPTPRTTDVYGSTIQEATPGVEVVQPGPQLRTATGLRETRTSLNARIKELSAGVSTPPPEVVMLQKVVNKIDDAISGLAAKDPEAARLLKVANENYKKNVVPYSESAFSRAFSDEDPMRVRNLFRGDNVPQQKRAFELAGPKGQAALRAWALEEMATAGKAPKLGEKGIEFAPKGAAAKLEAMRDRGTLGVLFPKGEGDGLIQILRTMDRTGDVGITGRSATTGLGAEMVGAAGKATTAIDLVGKGYNRLTKTHQLKLMQDPKGQALLRRAAVMRPGSPQLKLLISTIPKIMGFESDAALNLKERAKRKKQDQDDGW